MSFLGGLVNFSLRTLGVDRGVSPRRPPAVTQIDGDGERAKSDDSYESSERSYDPDGPPYLDPRDRNICSTIPDDHLPSNYNTGDLNLSSESIRDKTMPAIDPRAREPYYRQRANSPTIRRQVRGQRGRPGPTHHYNLRSARTIEHTPLAAPRTPRPAELAFPALHISPPSMNTMRPVSITQTAQAKHMWL